MTDHTTTIENLMTSFLENVGDQFESEKLTKELRDIIYNYLNYAYTVGVDAHYNHMIKILDKELQHRKVISIKSFKKDLQNL